MSALVGVYTYLIWYYFRIRTEKVKKITQISLQKLPGPTVECRDVRCTVLDAKNYILYSLYLVGRVAQSV